MHELSSQPGINGKGDKTRVRNTENYRKNYEEIEMGTKANAGFRTIGPGRIRKVYTAGDCSRQPVDESTSQNCCGCFAGKPENPLSIVPSNFYGDTCGNSPRRSQFKI
jgi:hypothetical protein